MNLFLVVFFTLTTRSLGSSPFRGRCKREAVFKKKDKDKALTNHLVTTLDVTSASDCTLECLEHPKCVSYNFQQTNSPIKKCELSDQVKTSNPADLISRPGYSYHDAQDFVLSVCMSSPCKNNGKCIDVCRNDYTCECTDGYIGENCQTWIGLNGTKPNFAGKSCWHIKMLSYLDAPDGKYWLNPTNTGNPFHAICDMTTDGGGWLVVKNTTLTSSSPTTVIVNKYDYRSLETFENNFLLHGTGLSSLKNDMGFTQIRFYCKKKQVNRVLHIMTTQDDFGYAAVRYLAVSNSPFGPTACNSFTRLPDDTSRLSQNCAKWGYKNGAIEGNHWGHSKNTGENRMYNQIIFWSGKYQLLMRSRYSCDDLEESDNHSVGDTYKMFVR